MEGIAELSEKKHPHTYQRKTTVLSGVWGNIINEVLHDFPGTCKRPSSPTCKARLMTLWTRGGNCLGQL